MTQITPDSLLNQTASESLFSQIDREAASQLLFPEHAGNAEALNTKGDLDEIEPPHPARALFSEHSQVGLPDSPLPMRVQGSPTVPAAWADTPGTVQVSAPPLRPALNVAANMGLDSDKVIQYDSLARVLGRPEKLVRETFEQSRLERQAQLLEKSPGLAAWAAADEHQAALAVADPEGLGGLFDYLSPGKNISALGSALDRGFESMESAALGKRFLSGDPKAAQDIAAHAKAAREKGLNKEEALLFDSMWLTSAVEQFPRSLQTTVPSVTESLGTGLTVWGLSSLASAGTGAAAGSFVAPGPGTVAGGVAGTAAVQPAAITAGKAAAIASYPFFSAYNNYELEKNIFAYEMAQERDIDGKPLDLETIDLASSVYGAAAGLLEGFTEAGFLALLRKGGGGAALDAIGAGAVKDTIKGAVKRIALDKVLQHRLIDLASRVSAGALMEAGTEYFQEWASILTEFVTKETSDQFFPGNAAFTSENQERALSAGAEGFKAGAWLRGGPVVASHLLNSRARAEAERTAAEQRELFEVANKTALKEKSPELLQDLLEHQGVMQQSLIPGHEALRLYQGGFDSLPEALGHSLEQIQEAAAKGQDLEVPVSRLAARLDEAQFESVLDVARSNPASLSLADLREDDALYAETRRVLERYHERLAGESEYAGAVRDFRESMIRAVEETPGLSVLAATKAGSAESFVNDQLAYIEGFAERHFPDPVDRSAFLRRVDVRSELGARLASDPLAHAEREQALEALVRESGGLELPPDAGPLPDLAELGDTFSPEEYARLQEQQILMEAMGITPGMSEAQQARKTTPWLDAVWGRLDGASLRRDYPEAFKVVVRNYGPGVFRSAERGGLPVDYLAAELVEQNLFQRDMGANELVERLIAPRERGRTLFQPLNEGVDLDAPMQGVVISPRFSGIPAYELSKGKRRSDLVKELTGAYTNEESGKKFYLTAQNARHAVTSATNSALDPKAAFEIVAALPDLIRTANLVETHGDLKEQAGIEQIHRYYSGAQIGGDLYTVKLTIKEMGERYESSVEGIYRVYDAKPVKKTPGGMQQVAPEGADAVSTPGFFPTNLRQLLEGVKDSEGGVYLQSGRKRSKGHVSISPDGYTITLGRDADLSTIIHESAHIFQEELRRLESAGQADERMLTDLRTLDGWLSRFDDDTTLKTEYDKYLKGLPGFEKAFRKLGVEEKQAARDAAKREYFARGFEAYMRDGVAPSEGLRAAFERFKTWLLSIYRNNRALGVELNDDVRGVFDRMLATEQEIEAAAAANELFALTREQLDNLGLTGPDREYAANLMPSAKQRAAALVDREKNLGRSARVKQWAADAREELIQQPVYAARAEMREPGKHLNTESLTFAYGEDAAAMLRKKVGPGSVRKEGGQDPDILAARHGFRDGAHMLQAIEDSDSLTARVQEIVKAREAEFDADIDPDRFLLQTEEAARQIELVGQYLARTLGREGLQGKAFSLAARDSLLNMPMRKARAYKSFSAAMSRALKRERAATARGDFEAAYLANTQARLNLEYARQALDIAALQTMTQRETKRFTAMKKADPDARYIINSIGMNHGLAKYEARLHDGRDASTAESWIKERIDDGYPMDIDPAILSAVSRDWRDMTLAEFESLDENLRQIVAVERNTRKVLTAKDKEDFAAVTIGLVETVHTHREAKPIKLLEEESFVVTGLRKIHAAHTKIEALCIALDGGSYLGENWTRIYKPINDAELRRGQYYKALKERLHGEPLFGAYSDKELTDMARKKEYVPEIGESITKEQRLVMALNMGNDGNYQRLQRGHAYSDEQIRAAVAGLDRRDWTFVQGIWDAFESYKEEAFALHEEITGLRPTSVEARPLTVSLPDGQSLQLRGGYFPVIYDSGKAAPVLQDALLGNNRPAFAQTRKGHLKERQGTGAGTPLDLSLTGIIRAFNDVITDITFRRAFIDVGRILKDKGYRQAIESTVGPEMYQSMLGWLRDAAGTNNRPVAGDAWLRWARGNATQMAMGFKLTTILTQPLGLTQTIEQIGWSDTMQGLSMAYGGGIRKALEMRDWVRSVSPMMDQRMQTYDRDVADATADFARQQFTPGGLLDAVTPQELLRFEKWLKKNAFVPMAAFQFGVDLPTWLGAYAKGLRDFDGADIKAKEYADSVVRMTQGSGQAKDLAQIQRGPEWLKALTMFYSYFNTAYNLTALRASDVNMHRDSASVLRAANSFLWLMAVPALLSEWVAGRGPDDDEEFTAWAAKQVIAYPTQMVVGLRDVAGFIDSKGFGYNASAATDTPGAAFRFLSAMSDLAFDPDKEADIKKLGKLTLRTYGYMKGLPLRQAEISAFNVIDAMDGDSDFELRDLFYVRQKSRR